MIDTTNTRPRVIAVANYKGGSAKTTSAVNLAAVLACHCRVLVINTDTQPHVELLSGLDLATDDLQERCALNLFRPEGYAWPHTQTLPTPYGYDVIGCGMEMVTAETYIATMPMGEQRLALLNDQDKTLADRYDVIILDTIGSRSRLVNAALIAADDVIIPIRPGRLDAAELIKFVGFLRGLDIVRMGRPPIRHRGMFLAQVQTAGGALTLAAKMARVELMQAFRDDEALRVCATYIPHTTAVAAASYQLAPIVHLSSDDRAARAYHALARELFPDYISASATVATIKKAHA